MRIKIMKEQRTVNVEYIPLESLNEWIEEELAASLQGCYKINKNYDNDEGDYNSKGYRECLYNLQEAISGAIYER